MATIPLLGLLAQLPDGMYVNPWKLVTMVVLFTCWAVFAQWVDKDTLAVNTFRVLWNIITLSTGVVGMLLMLFVPHFLLGILLFVVIDGGVTIFYIIHRNGLVEPDDKVFTPEHFRRIMEQGIRGKKKSQVEVKERVLLRGADGERVPIPEEEAEREQYRLSQDLLFDVLWRRASHVYITPAGDAAKVVYQVDGIKVEREAQPRAEADAMLLFFKAIAGLNLEERRKPQKAQISATIGENKADVIVQSAGSSAGEKLSLRIISDEKNYKIGDIGFTEEQVKLVREVMEAPQGVVLISAPPANGLTTSVYTITRSNDAFLQNIQMLEYEKGLEINNITQHVFTPGKDKSFAGDLQRVVRTDPDLIVLPDMRDQAAAVVASEAAAKKQNVYIGLAASDVFDALRKWIKLVGKNKLVGKTLLAVMNQRLVRKLCVECRQSYKPDPQMLRKINLPADKVLYRPPEPQYDKNGNPIVCQHCQGSGYVGRTAVFDLVVADDGMRKVIRDTGSVSAVQSYLVKKGRAGLQQQALEKVFEGHTSIQEVVRATRAQNNAGAKKKPAPKPKPRPDSGVAAQSES